MAEMDAREREKQKQEEDGMASLSNHSQNRIKCSVYTKRARE